jgi:DHA1 family 2-module integral membrane pump EmrD-like MFS transporter
MINIPKLKNNWSITSLVTLTITISQFSLILYTPSLPSIVSDFNISNGLGQMSIALYLITFGVSSLFTGPLSDHFGRKIILIMSIFTILIGTIIILVSNSITPFLIGRLIQGMGSGGPAVITRAVIRDQYHENHIAKALSTRILLIGIAPIIAPFLGGYIEKWWHWKGSFLFVFFYAIIMGLLIFIFYPETNVFRKQMKFSTKRIIKNYSTLIKNKIYRDFLLCVLLSYACQILYLTVAPFIFQDQLGITPERYGLLIIIPGGGFMIGAICSRILNKFIRSITIMFIGMTILFLTGTIWLISYNFLEVTVWNNLIPIIIALSGLGLVFPNATAGILKPFPKISGTAAALSGFSQMLGTGIISSVTSSFESISPRLIAWEFVVASLLMMGLYYHIIRTEKNIESLLKEALNGR